MTSRSRILASPGDSPGQVLVGGGARGDVHALILPARRAGWRPGFRLAAAVACVAMAGNDLRFVRETVSLLQAAGIAAWVFGGWAEELLGLAAPRPHKDLDLLYPADTFALADAVMRAGCGLAEITAKRQSHKRAFTRQAVMTELILLRPAGRRYVTDFRGELTYRWPGDVLGAEISGLRVASPAAVRAYRADHSRIHARKAGCT